MSLIRYFLLIFSFITFNHKNILNSKIIFQEVKMYFHNSQLFIDFKPLNIEITELEIIVNKEVQTHLINVKNFQQFVISSYQIGSNNVIIKINDKEYRVDLNIPKVINLTNVSEFKINDFLIDYSNIFDIVEFQYFKIIDGVYEIKNNGVCIELDQMLNFEYNNNYILAKKVELVIYNELLFENIEYNKGYHFNLLIKKLDNGYYLDSVQETKITLPLDNDNQVLDTQIKFTSIFSSGIDVVIDRLINVKYGLFSSQSNYCLTIDG